MNNEEKKIKKLYRSQKNKMIAGVCGGLGSYFKIDPTIIRLLMIFLSIITGIFPLAIAYFIAAVIISKKPMDYILETNYKKLYRSVRDRKIAGICGGIGAITKIDPVFLRLLFIFLAIITAVFPLLLAYIIGWIIIPEYPKQDNYIEIN